MANTAAVRFFKSFGVPGGVFLLLAVLMVIQPRRARQASFALLLASGLLMVSVFAANGSDAVGAGLGLMLGGAVLGSILGLLLGPILYVAVSAVLSGVTVAMLGAFAVFESSTLFPSTSQVNTKNSILCASVLFSTLGTGFALPALVRMAWNVDRPLFAFLRGRVRSVWLWVVMAVLDMVFWIIVVASNTDTGTGAWFLTLIGVVSFAAAFLFSGSAAEGTHMPMLATANALLVVSASFTVSTASSILSFYLILPLIVCATIAVIQAHEWTKTAGSSDDGAAEAGGAEAETTESRRRDEEGPSLTERVTSLPAWQRIALMALLLAVILFIMFTVDTRFHPAVFDAIIAVGLGTVLSRGVTLSEGGQQVLLVFTHAVFSFLALFGLSQVTTSSPSTASQRIGATVAFFGFTALCGALLAIFKMFVPRLNVIRNRFTVHVVETETDLVAIPCDASGTPVRDLDNVQSAPSTGPSGDGSTQEENAQKRTAAGDPTYETASPFYAPAPAPAPAYYPQSAPATSSEGDAPTTDV